MSTVAIHEFIQWIQYSYSPTTVLSEGVKDGESKKEGDNVKKVFYKQESVNSYVVVPKANGTNTTAYAVGVFSDFKKAKSYCKKNPQYTLYGATYNSKGEIKSATPVTKNYDLYRYRSDDSGKYSSFVDIQSVNATQEGNEYLKQYLGNFDTYKPVSIVRDTEIFRKFTSVGNVSSRSKSSSSSTNSSSSGGGDFASCLADDTIKERMQIIWDTALAYNYSEEQAASILGNFWWESGGAYDPTIVNYIGAFGICQWLGGRYDNLENFSKTYYKESTISFEAEVEFAMMELDSKNSYKWCAAQWFTVGHTVPRGTYTYAQLTSDWENSSDIDALVTAVCQGWERPGDDDGSIPNRTNFAKDAYDEFKGKDFGLALEVIDPDSSSDNKNDSSIKHSASTKSMNEKDRELYNDFYNAANKIFDGTHTLRYYSKGLTKEKQDKVLLLASSLARNLSMTKVKLDLGLELWEENFITNQSSIEDQKTYSSVSSADLAKASDFKDYDFMWPYAQDTLTNEGTKFLESEKLSSRFGPRIAPTAGATSNHKGIDLKATTGTKILAVSEGTVSYTGWDSGGGNWVEVTHGKDSKGREVKTHYMHLTDGSICVSVGQKVKKGDVLGQAGMTGAATGPHLHMAVLVNGYRYNPLAFYDLKKVPMVKTAGADKVEIIDFTSVGSLPSDLESSYKQYLYWDDNAGSYVEWNN